MPRHPRQVAETGIYHVMLRGLNRDVIFLEDADRERFLYSLSAARAASGCQVLAYCLMTNHVHLVLRTSDEPIGLVVKRLAVGYAGWFNRKYGRAGHLFQDRFLSRPVENDAYLVSLLRYVWNNPVEAGLTASPEQYRWSSRRFFGRLSPILDDAQLQRLLPSGELSGVVPVSGMGNMLAAVERPPRHTDGEVAALLRRSCEAANPDEFSSLPAYVQWRAVCELRMRSVPYSQIARVTGLSTSRVRRMHIAGRTAKAADMA